MVDTFASVRVRDMMYFVLIFLLLFFFLLITSYVARWHIGSWEIQWLIGSVCFVSYY